MHRRHALDDVKKYDAYTEFFGDARKNGGVPIRGAAIIRGRKRWLPMLRRRRADT